MEIGAWRLKYRENVKYSYNLISIEAGNISPITFRVDSWIFFRFSYLDFLMSESWPHSFWCSERCPHQIHIFSNEHYTHLRFSNQSSPHSSDSENKIKSSTLPRKWFTGRPITKLHFNISIFVSNSFQVFFSSRCLLCHYELFMYCWSQGPLQLRLKNSISSLKSSTGGAKLNVVS